MESTVKKKKKKKTIGGWVWVEALRRGVVFPSKAGSLRAYIRSWRV